MKQIERIQMMEEYFDESIEIINELEKIWKRYQENYPKIKALEEYYHNGKWRKDFESDEKGEIPSHIKRGILSEDGIYNLLIQHQELVLEIKERINFKK